MGYSMSLHLQKDAPGDYLESILKNSKFLQDNESIYVSQVPTEHGYAVPYNKGLYISFSGLQLFENCFVHSFFKMVASVYGEKIICPKDQNSYPFYNYDDEIILLMSEDEYKATPEKFKDFEAYNGVVVTVDDVEELFEEVERKTNEAREKNEVYEDKITMNIKHFSFDYIKSKPYKRESSVPNFIVNLLVDDNKLYNEIFETIKNLEIEFKNKKT